MKYFKLFEDYFDKKEYSSGNYSDETHFFGSSASGVLPIAKDTGRILIGLRGEEVNEPFTWGNFGGAIGLKSSHEVEEALPPEENARKELEEEIGLDINIEMLESYVFKQGTFIYYNYLGLIQNESSVNIDGLDLSWEVDEVKWVTLDELINHEDLHFGIESLLENAEQQIRKYAK